MKDGVRIAVTNRRTAGDLGRDVRVASSAWSRMRGLLGRAQPAQGEGLLLQPCNGVHTFGMRYPIDVLFLARDGYVIRAVSRMRASRCVAWVRGSHLALELPAGTIEATGTVSGDTLDLVPTRAASETDKGDGVEDHPGGSRLQFLAAAGVGAALGVGAGVAHGAPSTALTVAPFVVGAVVDTATRRVPNTLVVSALALALWRAIASGHATEATAGGVAALAVAAAMYVLARGAFGMGDVKLIAAAGAVVGVRALPTLLLATAAAGAVIAVVAIAVHRDLKVNVPYAPAIAAGALTTLLTSG